MKRAALLALLFLASIGSTLALAQSTGGITSNSVPLRVHSGYSGGFLEDDDQTVMHCVIDDPSGSAAPNCGKRSIKHKALGPFSDSNYLKLDPLGTGADLLDFTGDFYICAMFMPTSFSGGPMLFSNGLAISNGYYMRVTAGGNVNIIFQGAVGPSTGASTLNAVNVVCGGRSGTDAVIKLNNGTANYAGSIPISPATTQAAFIGRHAGAGLPFSGYIYEMIAVQATPSDAVFTAINNAALNCTNAGRCLPDDANTVLHLDGDDYSGLAWNGNPDLTTHIAPTEFKKDLGGDRRFFYYSQAADPLDFAGDYTIHSVVRCDASTARTTGGELVVSAGTYDVAGSYPGFFNTTGWIGYFNAPGGSSKPVGPRAHVPGVTTTYAIGVSGTTGYQRLHPFATQSVAGVTVVPATGIFSGIGGLASTGGASANTCRIYELWATSTAWSEATVVAAQNAAEASVGTPAFAALAAADPNTTLYLTFDDWAGSGTVKSRIDTVGGTWGASTGFPLGTERSRYSWPKHTFTPVGTVPTYESRLNWSSLTWTAVGAPTRSTTSSSYPAGFGVEKKGLSGWSAANYLQLGTNNDVLDTAGDFTACVINNPTSFAAQQVLASNGGFNTEGWYTYYKPTTGEFVLYTNSSGAATHSTTLNPATLGKTNVVCFGRGGTTQYAQLNDGALITVPGAKQVSGTNNPMRIGLYSGGTLPFSGTISEFFYTVTPPSASLIASLVNVGLACTTPGKCFPSDANTLMHCSGDDFSSGVMRCGINRGNDSWTTNGSLTLTSTKAQFPFGATKQDLELVGPTSDANYFTNAGSLLDFSGDWSSCFVYNPASFAAGGSTIMSDGSFGSNGWTAWQPGSGILQLLLQTSAGGKTVGTVNAPLLNSLNIGCVGVAGTTAYSKLNGGVTATTINIGTQIPASAGPARIGRDASAGYSFNGKFGEIWFSTTPASDALFTKIQQKWMNHRGAVAEPITVTRTTEASHEVDGVVTKVPPGVQRIGPLGRVYEGSVINSANYSEQFDNLAGWGTVVNVTPLADQIAAPNGEVTADRLTDSVDLMPTVHYIRQDYTATAAAWTISVYAKAGTSSWIQISPDAGTSGTFCNVSTCTLGSLSGAGTAIAIPAANGWCRCSFTKTLMAAGATNARVYMANGDGGGSYEGTGAGTVFLWGAQIEASPFPHTYCGPTLAGSKTCNADAITVANPFRPASEDWGNSILWSEALDNAGWTAGAAVTATNVASLPTGAASMDRVSNTGLSNVSSRYQTIAVTTAGPFVPSAWFAAPSGTAVGSLRVQCNAPGGTPTQCACRRDDGAACATTVNSSTCAGYSTFSTTPTRMHVEASCPATQSSVIVAVQPGQYSTTTGIIDVGGVQFSGAQARPYCGPTFAVAGTCSTGDWTNRIQMSEQVGTAPWTVRGTATVTANAALAPDGSLSADLLSVGSFSANDVYQTTAGFSNDTPLITSFWIKRISQVGTARAYNASLATRGQWDINLANLPDDWVLVDVNSPYKVETYPFQATAAGAGGLLFSASSSGVIQFYIWGVQQAAGNLPRPYCGPTLAAARTCGPGGASGKVVTNLALKSGNLADGAWLPVQTPVRTYPTWTTPLGNPGSTLEDDTAAQVEGVYNSLTISTNGYYTISCWLKQGTTSSARLRIANDAAVAINCDITGISSTAQRYSCSGNLTGAMTKVYGYVYPTNTLVPAETGSLFVGDCQIEAGAAAEPFCGPTESLAKTCAPEQHFCVRIKNATPLNGRGWGASGLPEGLFGIGVAASANSFYGLINSVALYFNTYDSFGVSKQTAINHGWATGSSHSPIFCMNNGVLSLHEGGTTLLASTSGTGTGLIGAMAPTVSLGSYAAAREFNGTIEAIEFNSTGNPLDF
jgi:hypothetical protein